MAIDAFISGIVSAVSLPMGAAIALLYRPGHRVVAAVMSFGAGALLAAVSFELLEPAFEKGGIIPLAIGFVLGSVTYVLFNAALDQQGGFLRKSGTLGQFIRKQKREEAESLLEKLSRVGILRSLPPEEIQALVPDVEVVSFPAGAVVVERGEPGDALYLIAEGEVEVVGDGAGGAMEAVTKLGPGDAFGEMALLTGEPRIATVRTETEVELLRIPKEPFDRLVASSPRLSLSVTELMGERLAERRAAAGNVEADARHWADLARRSLQLAAVRSTAHDEREVLNERAGAAALGIYLGLFLDGIPESLAIGALLVGGATFNIPLIAALFLANLPEAMSSSVIMRSIGYGPARILVLWGGLMLFTGVGAVIGNLLFSGADPFFLAVIFAMAAGAMLAMLAQTAMPEAFEQGGWVVGICTVLGFLAAYFMKAIGEGH